MSCVYLRNNKDFFMSCSVPPAPYSSLSKDFNELGFIHTYLGRKNFGFMIDAVEKASVKEIEIGKKQIYFAIKEVQDFLPYTNHFFDKQINNDKYYFFNNAFNEINNATKQMLKKLKAKPGSKKYVKDLNVLMVMHYEVSIISDAMKKLGLIKDSVKSNKFEKQINELISMQNLYPNLSEIKTNAVYLQEATDSLKAQLEFDFYFDMNELMRVYDQNMDERMWLRTQRMLDMNAEMIENGKDIYIDDYSNLYIKEVFVKSMRSLEKTFHAGLIFGILWDAINISKEKFYNSSKLETSPKMRYKKELENAHKRAESYGATESDRKYLKNLIKNKEQYIETEKENSLFQEKSVLVSIAQENVIFNTLNSLRDYILHNKISTKETLVLNKESIKGMFTGSIDDRNLIIYEFEVCGGKAVQAYFIDNIEFKKLEKIKERAKIEANLLSIKNYFSSSFDNMSSFIDEMKNKKYQIQAMGKEFDIVIE